jgi:hypothetical protein
MNSELAKRVLTLEKKILMINNVIEINKKHEEQYGSSDDISDNITKLNVLLEKEMNKREQHNINLYSCQCCMYITLIKSQYVVHTKSKKHIYKTTPNE